MHTISVINMKGGTGKTSTCHHLGGMLAKRGRRVLLVDDDPQSSLTQGFWGSQAARDLDPSRTIAEVFDGDPLPERVIHPAGIDNLRLLPGHRGATQWNVPPGGGDWGGRHKCIRSLLREVGDRFDICLIDCPPNLYLCSFAAMMASEYVIVPLQAEDYGAQGMIDVNDAIASVRASRGGLPGVLGYLLSMYDRRLGVHQSFAATIREAYPGMVFDAVMPISKDFKEAVTLHRPVSHIKKSGVALKALDA